MQVFERGLKAIPLSVDLWIHYLTHVKQNYIDYETFVRSQFERAVSACGLEFRSDKLWEAYIKWETESKRLNNVISVYNRLLATPTQGYSSHFEKYVGAFYFQFYSNVILAHLNASKTHPKSINL